MKSLMGKNRLEYKVYSDIFPLFRRYISLEETFKRGALHSDEIRNINDPALTAKFFSYALVCQGGSRSWYLQIWLYYNRESGDMAV